MKKLVVDERESEGKGRLGNGSSSAATPSSLKRLGAHFYGSTAPTFWRAALTRVSLLSHNPPQHGQSQGTQACLTSTRASFLRPPPQNPHQSASYCPTEAAKRTGTAFTVFAICGDPTVCAVWAAKTKVHTSNRAAAREMQGQHVEQRASSDPGNENLLEWASSDAWSTFRSAPRPPRCSRRYSNRLADYTASYTGCDICAGCINPRLVYDTRAEDVRAMNFHAGRPGQPRGFSQRIIFSWKCLQEA